MNKPYRIHYESKYGWVVVSRHKQPLTFKSTEDADLVRRKMGYKTNKTRIVDVDLCKVVRKKGSW